MAAPASDPSSSSSSKYTAKDVLEVVKSSSVNDWKSALVSLPREPCFRESMLWGMGVAALFAVHRFKQDSIAGMLLQARVMRSASTYLTWTALISSGCWVVCRRNQINQGLAAKNYYDARSSGELTRMVHDAIKTPEDASGSQKQ